MVGLGPLMIHLVAELVRSGLEDFLRRKAGTGPTTDIVTLRQFADAQGEVAIPANRVGMCLFNIDEERIMKNQGYVTVRNGDRVSYAQPEVRLNLYMLLAAHFGTYDEALKHIGWTIAFFQRKRVFTPENTPTMAAGTPEIAIDLYPMTLEQQNYLWTILGIKYLPSVAYQLRPVVVQEDELEREARPVSRLELQTGGRPPPS